jgi:hypothetical protein
MSAEATRKPLTRGPRWVTSVHSAGAAIATRSRSLAEAGKLEGVETALANQARQPTY